MNVISFKIFRINNAKFTTYQKHFHDKNSDWILINTISGINNAMKYTITNNIKTYI